MRRVSPPSARCRPGETPRWLRLDLSASDAAALREASQVAGVPLDAWLAITLEFGVALRLLAGGLGSLEAAVCRLTQSVEGCPLEMARDANWRAWQATVSGRLDSRPDDLPEVVLPERLLVRVAGIVDHSSAVLAYAAHWPLARACELVACGRGQTLEAFMLQLALLDVCPTHGRT